MTARGMDRSSIGGFAPPIAFLALSALIVAMACERRDVGHPTHDPGPVVARINGDPLYRTDLDAHAPGDDPGAVTAEERKLQFDQWVAIELLYDEAMRSGIGVSDEIDRKIEQYTKDLVADRLVKELLNTQAIVTRGEVLAYYREHRDEYNLEVRVSHILTNTMEEALQAREMVATRPFSWVARKMSVDRHTGAGGDLGYLSKGNMLPEFEDVVFTMKTGEVSDIIESEFGYHILKLTDIRAAGNELPFETVAPEISRKLLLEKRAAVYDSLVTALRARSTIEVLDPELQYVIDVADSLDRARPQLTATPRTAFSRAVPEPEEVRRPDSAEPDTLEAEFDEGP